MRNMPLAFVLATFLCAPLRAQTPFSETYFSATNPKPTGGINQFIRTPGLLYVHASTPYSGPYKRECVYALNPEGQRVWHSFDWDFDPNSELYFNNMFLAADGSLYLLVQEVINFTIVKNYLLRAQGKSGALLWKYQIPDGQTANNIFERTPGEIAIVYTDKNANYQCFLKTLSPQDGSVIRDQYLSKYNAVGIAADAAGDLVFASADTISKVNGLDPALVYWRTRLVPLNNSAYQSARFTFNPDGETAVFWGASEGSIDDRIEAVLNLNTGAVKITQEVQTTLGPTETDRIIRGDTAFVCRYNFAPFSYSKFSFGAYRITDGKLLYEKGFDIVNPATGLPFNDYSLSHSMDIDQDGNLYLVGVSSQSGFLGIMSVVKARAADGMEIWNKTVDITPGDIDALSYGQVAWCPPSNNKLWLAGMIQLNPNLKSPVLFELDKNTAAPLQTVKLGGNYDFPSGTYQFLPLNGGYCALAQLDNCAAVYRYDADQQLLWKKELCGEQWIKAGGIYEGLNNSIFVTGANYYTAYPTGVETPLKADSLLLYRLDLNTGNVQRTWKIPALDSGYPVHVSGLSDTIRYFVQVKGYRRTYRIINNFIQQYSGTYQTSITDPEPLLPLKTTYVQRGQETVAVISPTKYMVWLPKDSDGKSYTYPATTGSVQVACIAAVNGSREIIAAGNNGTASGYGLFRFKTGTSTLVWQNGNISKLIQRMVNVKDSIIYTVGCTGDEYDVMKFSATTGQLYWQKIYTATNYKPEVNDIAFDTITGRLLLCGSRPIRTASAWPGWSSWTRMAPERDSPGATGTAPARRTGRSVCKPCRRAGSSWAGNSSATAWTPPRLSGTAYPASFTP